jgi:hypothetical protein
VATDGTCKDAVPPTVTIDDGGAVWSKLTGAGSTGTAVDFPKISVSDNVDPGYQTHDCNFAAGVLPRCNCTAVLATGATAVAVYPAGVTGGLTPTKFPVGTTTVACVATDAAGNPSQAATFAVQVTCPPNHPPKELEAKSGVFTCTGATPQLKVQ